MSMEAEDVPLLTLAATEAGFPYPQYLHGVWYNDDCEAQEESNSEQEVCDQIQRASSLRSDLSQEPPLEQSQPLSQILEPCEERKKVSQKEAIDLLKQASCAAEAAQLALEKVSGEEFLDATGDELQARDNCLDRIRKRLNKLEAETRKRKWQVKNPDKTFLSSSACEDLLELKKSKGDDEKEEVKDEKGTQTELFVESRGVQTDGGGIGPSSRPFRKPFDELMVQWRKF